MNSTTTTDAIAEITSASHDNAEHGERGIRILRDFQHLEYGTKLYAHPAPCLHQIQEPTTAEQTAWHAGLDEGRAQAAATVTAQALTGEARAEAIKRLAPIRAKLAAAPAAVAVPDERAAFEAWASTQYAEINLARDGNEYRYALAKDWWPVWKASRAALAATPAAAPVVLPEPDFWVRPGATIHPDRGWQCWSNDGTATGAFHADTVRALLATATGLPAQAVEMPDFDLRTSKGGRGFVAWYFANVLQRYDYENYITNKLAADFACDLAKALSSTLAAPQAQADARDAEQEVLMEHSGCGSNTQVDMLTVRLNPGDKVVMHKGRITQGFDRANRAAIAAAKGE